MKAKRILSLLLTVAMIAACGVTAFAAPTGYSDYVRTNASSILEPWDSEGWNSNGAAPDENEIRADVVATKMTDAELEEAIGLTLDDWGVDEANRGRAWKVEISLHDIGTLYQTTETRKKTGFGIDYFEMYLTADKDIELFQVLTCDFSEYDVYDDIEAVGDGMSALDGKTVKLIWMANTVAEIYPVADGTFTEVPNAATFVVFADEGTKFTIDANSNVKYANFVKGAYSGADGDTNQPKNTVGYWHPATVALGEVEEEDPTPVDPTVGALDSWGTDGVAIKDNDAKYDNAYAVTASFENVGTYTKAGVLFIPAAVLGEDDLDLDNTDAVDAAAAAGIGVNEGGTLTVKAAIKGIPREYNGLTMVAKPYIVVGETPYYGAELSEVISFGNSGNK